MKIELQLEGRSSSRVGLVVEVVDCDVRPHAVGCCGVQGCLTQPQVNGDITHAPQVYKKQEYAIWGAVV